MRPDAQPRGGGQGGWGWLRAFCEASAVSALARFRHPLGIPLPHTAIIPQSKYRIADSLADFVRDYFLDPQTLLAKLKVLDPAQHLGELELSAGRDLQFIRINGTLVGGLAGVVLHALVVWLA